MKINKIKIFTLVITAFLLWTSFFIPVDSAKTEQIKINDVINNNIFKNRMDFSNKNSNLNFINLDTRAILDSIFPSNIDDNNDAGYKRDVGNEIDRSYCIYPGEMIDNWPGRGRTGDISSTDEEDWYFFTIGLGQQFKITLTPPNGFNLDLGLWDDHEDELATSTNTGSSIETITYTAPYTGKMYIRFLYVSGTGAGQYSFDVDILTQNDAGTGNDVGDDFASAKSITPGVYIGYLDMNDEEDWYKFSVGSGDGIHFLLEMQKISYLSDFDIYLYNPGGELVHYEKYYYDDELWYPADVTGEWRAKIKIYPGYTDIPKPTEWEYFTYGSGPYQLTFSIEDSAPSPPDDIPQPDITPVAQTFIVNNDPSTNKDEYSYLASVPACNYMKDGKRYLAPIVYEGDSTPTNWFGTVDDTTDYLIEDWNSYLQSAGKTNVNYLVDPDPIVSAANIAKDLWETSEIAVVAVEGSSFVNNEKTVLQKTSTLKRNVDVETIESSSTDFKEFGDYYAKVMLLGPKWGALYIEMSGEEFESPSILGIFPHYMSMANDWWPEYEVGKSDIYFPIPTTGIYAAGVGSVSDDWNMKISKIECDRYKIKVSASDSTLKVKVTTSTPEDLLVFLIDPEGYIRAPDPPEWNGGTINPIHEWNGIDDPDHPPECDEWKSWEPEPHTEFTAEVLHPEKGTWQAIVVPRYTTGSSSIRYTVTGTIKELNQKKANADISAANAAVIASQEHVPLLYVKEDSVPAETQSAFNELGINKVIFVQSGGIGTAVEGALPEKKANLKTMGDIVNYIKNYPQTENYITITSLKTGDGYFAPSAMLAAYHCSPVLRIEEAPNNPAGMANRIDTWQLWAGDYYHGNRAPAHLPFYTEPVDQISDTQLLIKLIKYLITGGGELPPFGLDAKRYWNEEMYNGIHDWISSYNLDKAGQEGYVFVAPRNDIRLEAHSVMMGNNSYAGDIPGITPSYSNDIIIRNILYPALIYANPNRDVTTTQLMNYPDRVGAFTKWTTNDGVTYEPITSSYENKKSFSSHNRIYEGHCLWEAHLKRITDGCSLMYYSGHGTGGSGISAQYIQSDYSNYPDQIWPDAWRSYMYDNWKTTRDDGTRWFNAEPPTLYDFIHFKWQDQLYGNLRSNAIFYQSCSTGQQFGPLIYLEHGAVVWYGNAQTGTCPPADLEDDWFFTNILIYGEAIGPAYSKDIWRIYRDYTTGDPTSMYGESSTIPDDGISTAQCIYGDPNLIVYSPEWTMPIPIESYL